MKIVNLSFRRFFLDSFLLRQDFYGDVIDIGGKKENTRGVFRPPLNKVSSWKYCNIDPAVSPDYLCSASNVPVPSSSFDISVICEVIEHLESPQEALNEIGRILKPQGKIIGSIPFMYPKHADPYDFTRWTDLKLKQELEQAGFTEIQIFHMGGTLAVVWDMLRIKCEDQSLINRFFRLILKLSSFVILKYYRNKEDQKYDNTSGFCFIAKKP